MKAALFAFLVLAGIAWAEEKPATFRYTAELEHVDSTGTGYLLWFNLRKGGESYTTWLPTVDAAHPEWIRFQRDLERMATDRIYYELTFSREIPVAKTANIPHLGIVTRENLRDLRALAQSRSEKIPAQLPITDLISIRPITQNEFLGITPRIVKP